MPSGSVNGSGIATDRPGFRSIVRLPEQEPRVRLRPRLAWVALVAAMVWLAFVGMQVALARIDAGTGRADSERAQRALGTGVRGMEFAEQALERAQASFASAHARVRNPLVQPVLVVPVLGRQLRSFTAMAEASGQLAGIASTTLHSVRQGLSSAAKSGPQRVEGLRRVEEITEHAEEALAAVKLGPENHLLPALATARADVAERVSEGRSTLHRAGVITGAVADLLAGPSRYLLLVANNAEMRAGSGMFLSASILESQEGSLSLGPMRPTADLALAGSGLQGPPQLQERWGWLNPGREWRNLAVSPRFDVTGELAARMWEAVDGVPVDGVIAIDVETLRAVLAATGAVEVGDASFDDGTVVDYLLHDQYLHLPQTDLPEEAEQRERREDLGALAQAAFQAIEGGSYDLGVLVSELAKAASGRHLLAWSAAPEVQRLWDMAGISGSMEADSLLVAVLNRGGNKLDRFLQASCRLSVWPGPEGSDVTVEVVLRNRTPPGQPAYVAGPHPLAEVEQGDYLGIVSVSVPGSAFDIVMEGSPPVVAAGPDGPTRVIATSVLVPAGTDRRVMVRFRLPATERSLQVEPSARIPAQEWRMGTTVWQAETPRRIEW